MSDSGGSQPSPISPICSPMSSESSTPRSSNNGNTPGDTQGVGHLLALLVKPREEGGYGGFLNYSEFAALTQPLHWSAEDVEDCWYDVVKGVPAAEVRDMPRVAEMVRGYCIAARGRAAPPALPSPPPTAAVTSRKVDASTMTEAGGGSPAADGPVVPRASLPAEKNPEGFMDSPKSTSVSAVSSTSARKAPPPPAPVHHANSGSGARRPSPAVRSSIVSPGQRRRTACGQPSSPISSSLTLPKRFAAATESSRRKRTPSPATRAGSAKRLATAGPAEQPVAAVFERLYARATHVDCSVKTQGTGEALVPAAAPTASTGAAKEQAELAECTFRPALTPYHSERLAKERTARPDCYRKPTHASLARLLGGHRVYDALADAPPTPRVEVRPAPGPSSHVPHGYVEGVARLRRGVARRGNDPCPVAFSQSLREGPTTRTQQEAEARQRLLEATMKPILRLPLAESASSTDGEIDRERGARECIDVRLATPLRQREQEARLRSRSRQRRGPRNPSSANSSFDAVSPVRSRASGRSREAASAARGVWSEDDEPRFTSHFKEHLPAYYSL